MCQLECQEPAYLFPTARCPGPHLPASKHACPFMGAWGGVSFMRPQCLPGGFGLGGATRILKMGEKTPPLSSPGPACHDLVRLTKLHLPPDTELQSGLQ